ncbi:HNH endonuclease signature motif containing protein [Prauserella muralis]|uniref:HNH endonuclease signature motif containing protein n=1 Tax=Prauserella muralis TaxID=588067 RepID=UPI0011BD7F10|nr:HNH endonuclease signature motif containing protein [Prauserella muralis]
MDATEVMDAAPPLSHWGEAELLDALRETERQRRRLYARELALLAEIDTRGIATSRGYTPVGLVRALFAVGSGAAQQVHRHAKALCPAVAASGGLVAPALPVVAAALAEGAIGPEHVEAIRAAIRDLPSWTTPQERDTAENILCDAARDTEPRVVARLGREIRDRLDPDGDAPKDERLARPERCLDLQQRPDGRLRGSFELDAESGALLTNLLSPLTEPRAGENGGRDPRTRVQRQGDALVDVLKLAARCPDAPSEAGEPVTLLVSATLAELKQGIGRGLLDGHLDLSAAQIRRMACDCRAAPMVFGTRGDILDVGRTTRTVPRRIRRALIRRDGGCTFPGCDRKPKWCQAHHVLHWIDGGPTALWNLVLLCETHHRLIHHSGWDITLIDGAAHYVPPGYLDPERAPRRNTLHTHRVGPHFRSPALRQPGAGRLRTTCPQPAGNPWNHGATTAPP